MTNLKSIFWNLPYSTRQSIYKLIENKKYKHNQQLFFTPDKNGNSFARNKELKCLFIHVPKTGGISINKTLGITGRTSHFHADTFQFYLSKKEYEEYFKFAIVRNPWDRLVSAFFFLKKGGIKENDKEFADKYLTNINSFETFVKEHLRRKEILSYIHFVPQYKFLCDYKGRLLVDYLGRFEDYENSYRHILDKLNLPYVELKKENINKSRIRYQDYYSPETTSIVSDVYSKDINLLNYSFD